VIESDAKMYVWCLEKRKKMGFLGENRSFKQEKWVKATIQILVGSSFQ